jgi:WD40 repeat protein
LFKALRFAPDGRSVATVTGDRVRFWDVATARETRQIAFPKKGSNDGSRRIGAKLAYSADDKIVAATSAGDGIIFLLDVATGRELGHLDQPKNQFKAWRSHPTARSWPQASTSTHASRVVSLRSGSGTWARKMSALASKPIEAASLL